MLISFFWVWGSYLLGKSLGSDVICFVSASKYLLNMLWVESNKLVTIISERLETLKFTISLCARILLVAILVSGIEPIWDFWAVSLLKFTVEITFAKSIYWVDFNLLYFVQILRVLQLLYDSLLISEVRFHHFAFESLDENFKWWLSTDKAFIFVG